MRRPNGSRPRPPPRRRKPRRPRPPSRHREPTRRSPRPPPPTAAAAPETVATAESESAPKPKASDDASGGIRIERRTEPTEALASRADTNAGQTKPADEATAAAAPETVATAESESAPKPKASDDASGGIRIERRTEPTEALASRADTNAGQTKPADEATAAAAPETVATAESESAPKPKASDDASGGIRIERRTEPTEALASRADTNAGQTKPADEATAAAAPETVATAESESAPKPKASDDASGGIRIERRTEPTEALASRADTNAGQTKPADEATAAAAPETVATAESESAPKPKASDDASGGIRIERRTEPTEALASRADTNAGQTKPADEATAAARRDSRDRRKRIGA